MNKDLREKKRFILEDLAIFDEELDYSVPSIKLAIDALKGNTPKSKGDYIEAVTELDSRIRVIDTAIPDNIRKSIADLGLDYTPFVMVYWHNGRSEVLNVVAHWANLVNNQ